MWGLRFKRPPRFRKWIELESQKNNVLRAVNEKQDDFPDKLLAYISMAIGLPVKYFYKAAWLEVFYAFYKVVELTACQIKLPMFEPGKDEVKDEAWNYENRVWHVYVHLLSHEFGWTIEYISNLKLEEVLPLVQEILIADQLEKEFQWTMSERSAYYDDKSKTTKANPLPRPHWMARHIDPEKELKKVKIPVGMMPAGSGISQSDYIAQAKASLVQ